MSDMNENKQISESALNGKSFREFLATSGLSAHLIDIVQFAMCMHRTADTTAKEGLEFLYRHIYASGRLGETAFL